MNEKRTPHAQVIRLAYLHLHKVEEGNASGEGYSVVCHSLVFIIPLDGE